MKITNLIASVLFAFIATQARADDWGCQVALCLSNPAGPTAVAECVPPITKLWKELAKGHAFPTCDMNTGSTGGNSATNQSVDGGNCPPQYRYFGQVDNDNWEWMCSFSGVVTIKIGNQPFARVWWDGNSSVTENISQAAKNSPGASTKYQHDYNNWLNRNNGY